MNDDELKKLVDGGRAVDHEAIEASNSDWILLFSGRQFCPLRPAVRDILIEDIAHALSHVCRFTGHVKHFYSVAQHCVLASHLVHPSIALRALLHDGSEAYICDVARPVKHSEEMRGYRGIEARLQAAVYERFGMSGEDPDELKDIDRKLLVTERRQLMNLPTWYDGGSNSDDLKMSLGLEIEFWGPRRAREEFLLQYERLLLLQGPFK